MIICVYVACVWANRPPLCFGNAGLFIWIDLKGSLPLSETGADGRAAERLLLRRFAESGVLMATAEYHGHSPGRPRVITSLKENTLRKGIRRFVGSFMQRLRGPFEAYCRIKGVKYRVPRISSLEVPSHKVTPVGLSLRSECVG
ncbi:hypothetical protein GGS23DRAFT_511323 [Durotheca rogersii]|uniref:uncharacterized protein n=1 Tax=Durotheca rogersii TaxID=419775 RepID=UPI00221EFA83|nr:uncharacterized protein GGS23DRAFT_511323 [Durotheca rogersii]KAI5863718.1 hypothetical protein GGS23DRAFT_511323 [Durotheca rogersii]